MGKSGINKKGRSTGGQKYVRIFRSMMNTPAWRSLNCVAIAAYLELSMRYNGRNNGKIVFSLRQMAEKLDVSKATAMRALNRLQGRGFIVKTKSGGFNMKLRHASEWRLTEFRCDRSGHLASHDYREEKKQTTVSPQTQMEASRVSR